MSPLPLELLLLLSIHLRRLAPVALPREPANDT